MKDKIERVIAHHEELNYLLADPTILNDHDKLKETAQEHSQLAPIVLKGQEYLVILQHIANDEEILAGDDSELKEIAQEELSGLKGIKVKLENELKSDASPLVK